MVCCTRIGGIRQGPLLHRRAGRLSARAAVAAFAFVFPPGAVVLLGAVLAGLVAAPVMAEDRAERAAAVRRAAAVSYSGRYEVPCLAAVLERAMDHPVLMGALWAAYGYAPAYRVSGLGEAGAAHVEDPTGIVGDLWLVEREKRYRVYLADGELDHWAVPALNRGTAVFEVRTAAKESGTEVDVAVFMEPESRIAGALLWLLSPVVEYHIENRISLNLEDAAKILEAIDRTPAAVADRLEGPQRQEFLEAF